MRLLDRNYGRRLSCQSSWIGMTEMTGKCGKEGLQFYLLVRSN